ncbi:hypothetical protein ALC53_09476, partial [Atta colombica]
VKDVLYVSQLTTNLLSVSQLIKNGNEVKQDNAALKLRIARLKELYHAFEKYHDELAVLDPSKFKEWLSFKNAFTSMIGSQSNL